MNVMLINDEGLRDDVKALVNFLGEFFIALRELLGELLLRKFVFDDPCRESVQICLTLSFGLGTLVGGDDDLCDLRFRSGRILRGFDFIKGVERISV